MSQHTKEVAAAARKLYDYLWANTGDTADWPLRMIVDSDEDLTQFTGLLNALGNALKDEDKVTHIRVFHSLDGLSLEEGFYPRSPFRFFPREEYVRPVTEKQDWGKPPSFDDPASFVNPRLRRYILSDVETIGQRTFYHYQEAG